MNSALELIFLFLFHKGLYSTEQAVRRMTQIAWIDEVVYALLLCCYIFPKSLACHGHCSTKRVKNQTNLEKCWFLEE